MHQSQTDSESRRQVALAAFAQSDERALGLLEEALSAYPLDGELLLAYSAAAAAEAIPGALTRLEQVVSRSPDWIAGQKALVQLKTEFGQSDPFAALRMATEKFPDNPKLWMAYISLLGAAGQHSEAAEIVESLRRRIGDVPGLCLLHARHLGLSGELEAAQHILDNTPEGTPELEYEQVRNLLRMKRLGDAQRWSDRLIARDDVDIGSWALVELCWRACNDPRHRWLLPNGVLEQTDLGFSDDEIEAIASSVRDAHNTKYAPIGQSVRGGTQTRGNLFLNQDSEIQNLFERVTHVVDVFLKEISIDDGSHPLSKILSGKPEVVTSWSILLTGGGSHVSHIHDKGLLSSALHLSVPNGLSRNEGELVLGEPPIDIPAVCEPLARFSPKPGHLVLFPSYLYHSTTPFGAGERLTVAFDVAVQD